MFDAMMNSLEYKLPPIVYGTLTYIVEESGAVNVFTPRIFSTLFPCSMPLQYAYIEFPECVTVSNTNSLLFDDIITLDKYFYSSNALVLMSTTYVVEYDTPPIEAEYPDR